jgi:hypothetical protein
MAKMQTMTGLMGSYYGQLRACHEWLVERGVNSADASTYVGAIMLSIAEDGKAAGSGGFQRLIDEQTPGGYNEQGLRELTVAGVFDEYKATMTSINSRWEGKTKGSDGRPVVRPAVASVVESRAVAQPLADHRVEWWQTFFLGAAAGALSVGLVLSLASRLGSRRGR